MQLFFRAAPALSSLQAALTLIRAVLPLLVLGVAKLFVDVATELISGGAATLPLVGVPADPAHALYLLGGLLLAVWLLDKAAWGAEEVVRTYSTNRVESYVHALIQQGIHAELAAVGGLYSRMFEAQAGGYQ